MNRRRMLLILMAMASVGSLAAAIRADVIIDSFQDQPRTYPLTVCTGNGALQGTIGLPHVLGGRGINLSVFGPTQTDSATIDINTITARRTTAGGIGVNAFCARR